MLFLGVLFTVVPIKHVSASPGSGYTYADYVNAIKKAADRLVALQSASDYGWDWNVTGLSSHSGNSSATNVYGVTALGLIDAHGRTGTTQYFNAARNVANFMNYGDPSNGDFYNGHDSYYWGFSFDYKFLMQLSNVSVGYENYALAAWAWQKTNRSEYYGDGNQTALYDWYMAQVNHGYAGWSASDWGLAAWEMGDTVWAQHMASVISVNLADVINGTTPGGPSRDRDLGMAWALKLLATVDPTTYASNITTLKSKLEADKKAQGYWTDGNPDGDAQTTAYAVMGLWAAGEYDSAGKGAEWLLANQMISGGWTASPTEYSETDSEATQALAAVFLPLTVVSAYDSPSPTSGLFPVGTNITASVTSPVFGGAGKRYVCTGWTGTGSVSSGSGTTVAFTITQPSNITWNWETQYVLLVTSPYGIPTGQGWYDAGSLATFSVTETTVGGGPGIQYVFTGWSSGSAYGYTGPSSSYWVFMNGMIWETANWKTQYYLTVVSPYDTAGGTGWYDNGTTAYATLANGTVDIVPGSVRAVFTGWSGDASGTGLASNPISMDRAKTVIATWKVQYYLTVVADPSKLVTIPGEEWHDNGTRVDLTAPQYVPNATGVGGVRFRFSYWDVDGTSQGTGVNPIDIQMNASHAATAHYVLQYLVTFNQSGVGNGFNGTVVAIDDSNYGVSTLPTSLWYDNGSTHNFAFQSPLAIAPGAQYVWTSTTGISTSQSGTITVTGSGTVTGNYASRMHDVAVTYVVANCTRVYQGQKASINITVRNNGNVPETVAVTLYYNITASGIVDSQNVSLLVQEIETITFIWSTEGVPCCHNYTLTAVGSIAADSNPADNTLAGANIKVRIVGDINGDDVIDMKDIGIAARDFGSYPGHPRWNPDADINGDGKVDMRDIALIARGFGKHG